MDPSCPLAMGEAYSSLNQEEATGARVPVNEWISQYEVPDKIHRIKTATWTPESLQNLASSVYS